VNQPAPETVARAQAGDVEAYADIVRTMQQNVFNVAMGVLSNQQEAEDMTQEVFVRVWRSLPTFRGDSAFGTWLYRITVNACLNRQRKLGARLRRTDDAELLARLPSAAPDPQDVAIQRERRERVWSLVEELPDKYRLVIILFYQQQLSYREISEVLSLPLGTVKAHLNRARTSLARRLRQQSEQEHAVL